MNTRRATNVAIDDEIELREIVELPEGRTLPDFQEKEEEEKDEFFEETNELSDIGRHIGEKFPSRVEVVEDEMLTILEEGRIDTLAVIFEDEKYTDDVSKIYDKEPSLSELLSEVVDSEHVNTSSSMKEDDIVEDFIVSDILSEDLQGKALSVEDQAGKNIETLEKLDSLDAMVSSMITGSPLLSDVKDTLMDTVSAITDTVLEDLRSRIEYIEVHCDMSQKSSEFSLEDTVVVEQIKTIFSREFDEKYAELDNKIALLSPRLDEVENHLQTLLVLSKRVNTLESSLDTAVSKIDNTSDGSVGIIEEQMKDLVLRVDSMEETKDALSMLNQRFQKLEDVTKEYKNGDLVKLEAHCAELEDKIGGLVLFVENIQKEKVNDAMSIFGERIARLEVNIELLAKEKAENSVQNIRKDIEDSLRKSIEKEATMAASKIIREELQALLQE
ncbi:MAG: hypothetical protein ACRCV3_04010 [Desulfovibrionaceae bacterium]